MSARTVHFMDAQDHAARRIGELTDQNARLERALHEMTQRYDGGLDAVTVALDHARAPEPDGAAWASFTTACERIELIACQRDEAQGEAAVLRATLRAAYAALMGQGSVSDAMRAIEALVGGAVKAGRR